MRFAAAIALVAGFGMLLQTTLIHALPSRFQIAPAMNRHEYRHES